MKRRTPMSRIIGLLSAGALLVPAALYAAAPAVAVGQNGTTLTATVSVTAQHTRTYDWALDKSASPDTLDMFAGDSGTAEYTVKATRDEGTVAASLGGQVCVTNGGAEGTQDLAITANVSAPPDSSTLYSSVVDVSSAPVIAAGATSCYHYTVPIGSPVVDKTYKVTADVTISNHSGHLGTPFGPSPSATTSMPGETPVHDTLAVSDSYGGQSWTFTGSGSDSYQRTFSCDTDAGAKVNTVTSTYADGTAGPSDSATVTVNCYSLDVSKTVDTSYTRTYAWNIDKSADQSALTLALNQSFLVNYRVDVWATHADSAYAASGTITVHNPAPMDATLTGVTDMVGDIGATVTCPVEFPYTLGSGDDLQCGYAVDLPSADAATNTATATLQNTPSGTTDFTGSAGVDFSTAAVTEVDKTATVGDSYQGDLGTLSASDAPKSYSYTRSVGPYTVPGDYTVDNTATVKAGDTGTESTDSWKVNVTVPSTGCSLTIGYWKTHAGGVGKNADMVTPLLPIWLGTGTGKSVQVLTAGQAIPLLNFKYDAANGINKLYGQLLAAKLNIKDGANGSAVASTITAADTFLASYDSSSWSGLSKAQKTQVNNWVAALDNYNNGFTGPGHCTQ